MEAMAADSKLVPIAGPEVEAVQAEMENSPH
jgi:hypothetical protein